MAVGEGIAENTFLKGFMAVLSVLLAVVVPVVGYLWRSMATVDAMKLGDLNVALDASKARETLVRETYETRELLRQEFDSRIKDAVGGVLTEIRIRIEGINREMLTNGMVATRIFESIDKKLDQLPESIEKKLEYLTQRIDKWERQ